MKRRHLLRLAGATLALPFVAPVAGQPWTPGAAAAPRIAPRFGAVEAFRASDQARDARLGWERIIFYWHDLQPSSPDDWNGAYFPDDLLRRSMADGRDIVGLLIGTPPWASDGGRAIDVPRNLDRAIDDPANYWARFVKKAVATYRGRIRTWVIWNEPDIWNSADAGYQWAGDVADYYRLLKTAYLAAKSVDPTIRITTAGLTHWWDKQYGRPLFFGKLLDLVKADPASPANSWFFDAAVLQLYNDPIGLYEIPIEYKSIMFAHGIDKPIWINETNVAPAGDPAAPLDRAHFRASLDEQASYIIEASAAALAAGVERLAYYKMRDDPLIAPGRESFGLVRPDASTRPAFEAVKVVTQYFDGVTSARLSRQGDLVVVTMDRPGERIDVVWNQRPRPISATLPALGPRARLVDRLGHESELTMSPNGYQLTLPPATHNTAPGRPNRYLTGGGPFLLVQASNGQPAAPPPANQPGVDPVYRWTAPTGEIVSGEWLTYLKAVGDTDNLGYPRGPVELDAATGQTVQAFQRSTLEYHPELPVGQRIQRRLLGDILYPGADPPLAPTDAPPGPATYFPFSPTAPTGLGHFVSDFTRAGQAIHFKQHFDTHGGVLAFGYPKEEPKLRDGRWTQRFQAAVFEYHVEMDRDGYLPGTRVPLRAYRVQLELLGDEFAAQHPR